MPHCGRCDTDKPLEEFSKSEDRGHQHWCKRCVNDYSKSRYNALAVKRPSEKKCADCGVEKPASAFASGNCRDGLKSACNICERWRRLKNVYGLERAQFESMFALYEGKCWICRRRQATAVDHCHETGRVRGLLCHICNTGLGKFDDSPESLSRAIAYLRASTIGSAADSDSAHEGSRPSPAAISDVLFKGSGKGNTLGC